MNKTRRIEMTVELVRILVAIGIAYGIALVTLFAISEEPIYIIKQFVLGPLSSQRRIGSIINLAIPFTFTGLCFCFMYAVNKFNLAGEGIFMFSGCIVALTSIYMGNSGIPSIILIPLLILIGAVTGFVISMIPAYLDAKFGANTVVVSLMLNSILMFLSIWVLKYFMRDPTIGSLGSLPIPEVARLASVFGKFKIQAGIFIAIIAVIAVT
ncbi:MAG: ABC transporter permease, partial [Hungatella sp.]